MKRTASFIILAAVLLFLYLPIIILAVYSFTDAANIGTIHAFSLQNYKYLFTSPDLLSMISGTFLLAFGSALLATLLGTVGAIGAFYSKSFVRGFMNTTNQIQW